MITAEIKVNGILIGVVYARNTTQGFLPCPQYEYACEYYEVGSGKTLNFKCRHDMPDGAEKLMAIIFEKIFTMQIENSIEEQK